MHADTSVHRCVVWLYRTHSTHSADAQPERVKYFTRNEFVYTPENDSEYHEASIALMTSS